MRRWQRQRQRTPPRPRAFVSCHVQAVYLITSSSRARTSLSEYSGLNGVARRAREAGRRSHFNIAWSVVLLWVIRQAQTSGLSHFTRAMPLGPHIAVRIMNSPFGFGACPLLLDSVWFVPLKLCSCCAIPDRPSAYLSVILVEYPSITMGANFYMFRSYNCSSW